MCERTGTAEPRKRKAPKHLEVGEGDAYYSPTAEDHYRRIYFEALDLAISSILERFDQPGYSTYQNLEELLLKAANGKDYSTNLQAVTEFYGDDFNVSELTTQLLHVLLVVKIPCMNFLLTFKGCQKARKYFLSRFAG